MLYPDKPDLRPELHSVGPTPESSQGCIIRLLAQRITKTQRVYLYQILEMKDVQVLACLLN